jgi:hypothetical protein
MGEASIPALYIRDSGTGIQKSNNLVRTEKFGDDVSVAHSVCGYTQGTLGAQSLWCIVNTSGFYNLLVARMNYVVRGNERKQAQCDVRCKTTCLKKKQFCAGQK